MATKVKMSGSEKNRVKRNTNVSTIKRVSRKLKVVLRLTRVKQRQGNVQRGVLHVRAKLFQFLLIRKKKVCCTCKVVSVLAN